ncbi:hypothetical protein Taro_020296 [Colocasia esculenta]|uniref:Peroxidase n=1 Tax=Colocasia esculenta TaxID=4460 RepID=A0A843UVZ4_COLES|nr:hypothetical protein [Colocasia esculenta]
MASSVHVVCFVAVAWLLASRTPCEAQLTSDFYDGTCPRALSTIRTAVRVAIARERRMAASLIRLHFHDCFVQACLSTTFFIFTIFSLLRLGFQGCDASILLDDAPTIVSEKNALQNFRSARGFEVVDEVKSKVEAVCPGVVSCSDILAVAARDASEYVGGPTWRVKLGRRDSTTASKDRAEKDLPRFTDSLDQLISLFSDNGLSARDMVALSGAHTIGQAACVTFRDRIYNGTNIDAGFAKTRQRGCPSVGGNGNLAPFDLVTPNSFDENYYKNLLQRKGLIASDQVLFSGGSTDAIVTEYSRSRPSFLTDFAAAMVRMGDINPLTGTSGQIRRSCQLVN